MFWVLCQFRVPGNHIWLYFQIFCKVNSIFYQCSKGNCLCCVVAELPLCQGVTCEANSECVVRDGAAVCDCKLGYTKQGSTCQGEKLLWDHKWSCLEKILSHWYLQRSLITVSMMPTLLQRFKTCFSGIPIRSRAKLLSLLPLGHKSRKWIGVAGSIQHSLIIIY